MNVPILPDDYEADIVLQRLSQDHIVNSNGRKSLEFCKAHSLRLCNGRYGDDKGMGKFTYIGHNGRSVVFVDGPNILSDHCAIHFSFRTARQDSNIADRQINPGENINKKYKWDSEKSEYRIE